MQDKIWIFPANKNTSDERQLAVTFGDVLKAAWKGLLIALVCSVALVLLFALLADKVFDKGLVNTDNRIALWSYSLTNPVLTFGLTVITEIGSPLGIAILTGLTIGFFIWRKMYAYACLAALTSLGSAIINETLKQIFHRVRPDLLPGGPHLTSYSFPSGHSTGSICFFGFLIWASWKLLKSQPLKIVITIALSLMILLVGFSRIYLGFHYPTDVLGAYLSGGCWLIALLSSYNIFYRYRHFHSKDKQA
ncbi:MAG: phosphatase PAP2 family protein [Chloroflexi bacterium]|nr:phosphatase PAP2 family protein [Chloroflexota bacterium]OJV92871.1 MAG: hypothetical protein BGO39_30435 [Chloroflexi bacterium 54-19]